MSQQIGYVLSDCSYWTEENEEHPCWGTVENQGWDSRLEGGVWEDYEVISCKGHEQYCENGMYIPKPKEPAEPAEMERLRAFIEASLRYLPADMAPLGWALSGFGKHACIMRSPFGEPVCQICLEPVDCDGDR